MTARTSGRTPQFVGAVTASGYGTVSGQAADLNVGDGLVTGRLVVDVCAIEIGSDDEKYELHLMGGDDASFTETASLACIALGAEEELEDTIDSEPGRYEIPFWNKKGETIYPYLRIRHVVSGSVCTGIDYAARFEEL